MKLTKVCTCSICDEPLRWWSAQSCIRCHMSICKKHTCTIRRSRSSVLFSFCTNCALEAAKRRALNGHSLPGIPRTASRSLPGFSFSGFSFSGFSLSGISFSGFKREKPQVDRPAESPDSDSSGQSQALPDEAEKTAEASVTGQE